MRTMFLTIALLTLVQGTTFSLKNYCSCSEYTSNDVCSNIGYCSWINNTCVDLQCSTVTSAKCDAENTMYKCGWNSSTSTCESKSYSCNDITTSSDCKSKYGLDCVWQTSTGKCINFTCTGIDSSKCDTGRCSNINGTCGEPQNVDCTTLSQTVCLSGIHNGYGKICFPNDSGTCKEYNVQPENCGDYGDLMIYCMMICSYDETTKTCSKNSCSKQQSQSACEIMVDYYELSITPCYWTGTTCQDATDTQISQYNLENCLINTMLHYAWNADSQKCMACSSYTSNPAFNGSNVLLSLILTILFIN